MSIPHPPPPAAWNHVLEPLLPAELAPLQRRYVASLPVPTLTDLDLRLRDNLKAIGVKVGGETVAFALIQPTPDELPGPLLLSLAAPGQSSVELRAFFREVVRQQQVRALWGRSDDALLLEVLMLEGWKFSAMGPLLMVDELLPAQETEGIELRHLDPSHLEPVVRFFARLPAEDGGTRDRGELRKMLQDRVLDGLFEHGELRGVAQLLPQHHPQFVSLEAIVDPDHRGRGFGRLLASDVVAEEIAAGRQVLAAFRNENLTSRRLVESIGAQVVALYYLATPGA